MKLNLGKASGTLQHGLQAAGVTVSRARKRHRYVVGEEFMVTMTGKSQIQLAALCIKIGALIVLASAPVSAGEGVIYVNQDAAPGGNGTSWQTAYRYLQDGLSEAGGQGFGEIWVAKGTYRPDQGIQYADGNRAAAFFLRPNTIVLGGFFGNEVSANQRNPQLNQTILSGDLLLNDGSGQNSDNAYHVVAASNVENAILDGFTIRGGVADADGTSASGAGLYVQNSIVEVRHCRFTDNLAVQEGGAVYIESGAAELIDSQFTHNKASEFGGALAVNANATAIIVRSIFEKNNADRGGAVYMESGAGFIAAVNSGFFGNEAVFTGGAIYVTGSSLMITTVCTMSGNRAQFGGAVSVDENAELIATHCTLAANDAFSSGGGVFTSTFGDILIRNSILWQNVDMGGIDQSAQINIQSGNLSIDYCRLQGWLGNFGGVGNNGFDPVLAFIPGQDGMIGTRDDNLRILAGSSAIDAGANSLIPLDGGDVNNNGITNEDHPIDLDGNPRRLNDIATVDTGEGFSPITDIGAYEYFADCNNNGIPDFNELKGGSGSDCNGNLVLDECDIRDCDGGPDCDDCNRNGLPDSCDIESGKDSDTNGDDIPDSCVRWTGDRNSLWSESENWSGGQVPNNFGSDQFSVTVRGNMRSCVVDVPVQINSLRILDGARVQVNAPCNCDLEIMTEGGLVNNGMLEVADDRNVLVPNGPFVVGLNGVYRKSPASPGLCTSELFAQRVEMFPTYCGATDQITLVDEMILTTVGDFVMDGRGAIDCYGNVAGGQTPPILKVVPDSSVQVGGSARLTGRTDIDTSLDSNVAAAGPGGNATIVFDLTGDFVNESTDPTTYQMQDGGILVRQNSSIEVASRDVGPSESGFGTMNDPNFSLGGLQLEPGAQVTFKNQFANIVSADPCREAMYIDAFDLAQGSTIVLDNVNVYYRDLMLGQGVEIIELGCGQLSQVCDFNTQRLDGTNGLGVCDNRPFLEEVAAFQTCYSDQQKGGLRRCCTFFDFDDDGDVDDVDYVGLLARIDLNPNCCVASNDCGCGTPAVEECVCSDDPFCCDTAWDLNCSVAASACLGGSCTHGCCEEGPSGCDSANTESCVCGIDPFCCENAWDYICIQIANSQCGRCGP